MVRQDLQDTERQSGSKSLLKPRNGNGILVVDLLYGR